jgi:hypothetical protein
MSTIRVHFDGKVFVPEEPVDIPVGTGAQVILIGSPAGSPEMRTNKRNAEVGKTPLMELAALLEAIPDKSDLPSDFASQIDHYVYGAPKRD